MIAFFLRILSLLALFFFALVGAGCSDPAEEVKMEIYPTKGVVQEVKDEGKVLIVDHEEMPGYMKAMIMPFKVKDPSEAEGLKPGDVITFDYKVQGMSSWIEGIEKTAEGGEVKTDDESAAVTSPTELLEIGADFPDYEFVDENGLDVKLSDYRGMPVAFTFIFTQCPVPEYCPNMMVKFAEVDAALKADAEAPEDWRLLSISFDTWNDTPEVMKAYGKAYGQDPAHWSMLTTDSCCTINEIGGNVGLKYGEKGGSYQHNLRTAVLDAEGKLRYLFTDETWEPAQLIDAIKTLGAVSS